METLQERPVFKSNLFDLPNAFKNIAEATNPARMPEVVLEEKKFKSDQRKLVLIIIFLWMLVQMITLIKNVYIYNMLSEQMDYTNHLIRRLIPIAAGIAFICLISISNRHLQSYKIKLLRFPILHFLIATTIALSVFSIGVYAVNHAGLNTFANSSISKYFMVEIDRLFLIYLLISITSTAHYYFHEVRLKELALARVEKVYQQAEIISLNNEVNPHMISNTLNNISSLISIDVDEAKRMIVDFAQLLRQNLRNKDSIFTTLYHERKFIKTYVNLQNIDRRHKYKIAFQFPESIQYAVLPKMVLQPLVENAIKHSHINDAEILKIKITAEHVGHHLTITVKNRKIRNVQSTDHITPTIGIGTENIIKRLKVLYRTNYRFELNESEKYFTCTLKIPFSLEASIIPT